MPQLIASVKGVEVKHVYLTRDRTTLGRKPENDIVLDNPVVSGQHCAFHLVGVADIYLEDLGSTNGTYVNDRMIRERTKLRDSDLLAIGPYRIRYLQASEEPTSSFGETQAMMGTDSIMPSHPMQAVFEVVSGTSAGLEVPVVKAVTTFGRPGVAVVSVAHRRNGFFVTHLAGSQVPRLNGLPLGETAVMLTDNDVLDLAGTQMRFQLRE